MGSRLRSTAENTADCYRYDGHSDRKFKSGITKPQTELYKSPEAIDLRIFVLKCQMLIM